MIDPRLSKDGLADAISREDWDEVVQCEAHPEKARIWHVEKGFFQGDQDSVVLPIHQAVAAHDPSIDAIHALIQAYPIALLCKETTFNRLPLHLATQNPNISTEIIQILLDFAPETAMECDLFGRLALHYACCNGASVATVDALLTSHPPSVYIRDVNGWLPIHIACRSGACFRVVKHLLDAYPESIVAETSMGNTPLDMMLCQHMLGGQSAILSGTNLRQTSNEGMNTSTVVEEQVKRGGV